MPIGKSRRSSQVNNKPAIEEKDLDFNEDLQEETNTSLNDYTADLGSEPTYEPESFTFEDDEDEELSLPDSAGLGSAEEAITGKSSKSNGRKAKEEKQSIEIDTEKKRLLPFGSTKGNVFKVSDADNRRNAKTKQKTLAAVIILGVVSTFGWAGYNALWPKHIPDTQEIAAISMAANGNTNFPLDTGGAIAVDFIKGYISEGATSSQRLESYFFSGAWGGSSSGGSGSVSKNTATNYKQSLITGPTVYKALAVDDENASYTIGAAILPSSNEEGATVPKDGSTIQWIFFNVNVNYDPETGAFGIAPNSPSIVPPVDIKPQQDITGKVVLGTGERDKELEQEIRSTVNGYVQAYANSSPEEHSALDQYVIADADSSVLTGLAGEFSVANEGAISFEAFPVEEDTSLIKARVNVTWTNTVEGYDRVKAEYGSRYVMTLKKTADGKYLVQSFTPELFIPEE